VPSVQQDGIFRREYDALLARNGHRTIPALMAVARMGLRRIRMRREEVQLLTAAKLN
jgi:hypothetical protein